ncbi:hypothetical protein FB451DRAFT_1221944 [Mycena latifolia]|nr:hypothetical protein FB451DRAFT_1221944 [Mycena latifolia]
MSIAQLTLPLFLGTMLNWTLFGTLLVQVYIYFTAFPNDLKLTKHLVIFILFLEVLESLSNARDMIHIFGAGWGNAQALDDVGWAWFSVPVMGAIIACVGQLFFARRIHILGRGPYIPSLIAIVAVVQLVAGIWTGVVICIAKKFSLLQIHNEIATATWLAATALCDLIIVFSTVFYLIRSTQPEFRKTTNVAITRIIMITVETGLLCALFAIFDLYLFVMYKGTNYHLSLCIELSKIYSNSILMVLNSRACMGHTPPCDISHNLHISDMRFNLGTISTASPFHVDLACSSSHEHEAIPSRGNA